MGCLSNCKTKLQAQAACKHTARKNFQISSHSKKQNIKTMGILAVPDNNVGLTALLVNTYAGQPAGQIQQAASQLSLTGSSSNQTAPLHDLVPICQQLARLSASKSQQLLGADPAQQAQVGGVGWGWAGVYVEVSSV